MGDVQVASAAPVLSASTPRLMEIGEKLRLLSLEALPSLLGPGDVVVLNDAATFPGSLHFQHDGQTLEVRLFEKTPTGFRAVLFGPGDFHTRTEDRAAPPRLPEGTRLELAGLTALISRVDPRSPRLVELEFLADDATQWAHLYAHGAPIQYAHQPTPLPLWAVQNVYAERPWAAELPSAGHHLSHRVLGRLGAHGVRIARLTHATGLSSTGDPRIDASLPFPERYDIPSRPRRPFNRRRASSQRAPVCCARSKRPPSQTSFSSKESPRGTSAPRPACRSSTGCSPAFTPRASHTFDSSARSPMNERCKRRPTWRCRQGSQCTSSATSRCSGPNGATEPGH
jgi:Queuosine biosynthesis protein